MMKPIALALLLVGFSFLPCSAQGTRNGLPPTMMDSFVYNAGGNAFMIYGDEGTDDIPPLFGYTSGSRINSGISGVDAAGLTTGHGSVLPSATGADEFLGGEWSMSGSGGGNWASSGANGPVYYGSDGNSANLSAQNNAVSTANSNALNAYNQMQSLQSTINAQQAIISSTTSTAAQVAAAQTALAGAQLQFNAAQQSYNIAQQQLSTAQGNYSTAAAAAEASSGFP